MALWGVSFTEVQEGLKLKAWGQSFALAGSFAQFYYCKQIILFNLKQILSVKLEIKDNLKI